LCCFRVCMLYHHRLFHWDCCAVSESVPFSIIVCFTGSAALFQSQYGYLVIQLLLSHLDKHVKDDPEIKTSIITVLFEAVLISAGGSIGRCFVASRLHPACQVCTSHGIYCLSLNSNSLNPACQVVRKPLNMHTPYVCGFAWSDMVHGCMVYTERAEMAAVSCGTSHASTVSTPLRWIFKNALYKAIHSCRITCEHSESAQKWRTALYKSDQ